jgi:hypothetical protein
MSDDSDETSPGGSRIFRHQAPGDRGFEPATGDPATIEAVDREITRIFGPVEFVWHEVVSDRVHIDVHAIPPTDARPHYTLVTSGMSDQPMTVPEGCDDLRYAELVLKLPPDWPFPPNPYAVTPANDDEPAWYWPVRWLKALARLPHDYSTWLGQGHTVPNGDPPEPFAPGTRLCCWMLLPDVTVPENDRVIAVAGGRKIHLYVLHALTLEETSLKLDKGADALLGLFDARTYSDVLDPGRASLVRKKLFGLF